MKIGKIDWDLMFLDLIEMNKRHDILDALNSYYEAFNKEKTLVSEYSKQYEDAIKSVKHLENKNSLTEDEFLEWEGTVGWYETLGEEIGFREESLATGLIIALWKLVNHLSLTVSQGLKSRSRPLDNDKFDIFRIGPQISGTPWALSLNAASNYVRHSEDWNKDLRKYIRSGSDSWELDIPEKDGGKNFSNTKRNLKILEGLGIDIEMLILSNNLSYRIAEKIGILDKVSAEGLYLSWVDDVYKFTKSKLGK